SGPELTRAVRSGEIRRIRRAWYGTDETSAAQYAAIRVGGKLGGISAAASYGFWSGQDRRIHVLLPRNACRLRTNILPSARMRHEPLFVDKASFEVVLHWHEHGIRQQEPDAESPWRASVIECLLQVLAWESAEPAVACVDPATPMGAVGVGRVRPEVAPSGLGAA